MNTVDVETSPSPLLFLRVRNVTGTQELPIEVDPDLSVRAVAESIAHRMALPGDVPWALRDDSSTTYLDEEHRIGDQISADSHLTLTPKAHLGGGA